MIWGTTVITIIIFFVIDCESFPSSTVTCAELVQQFPKFNMARPPPYNVVLIEPVSLVQSYKQVPSRFQ